MSEENVFGIDFGTTNSLISIIRNERAIHLTDTVENRPHPSLLWYRGSEIVVGQEARRNLDLTDAGAPPGFVRSPKMALRQESPIHVEGREVDPSDAIGEVLRFLVRDARQSRQGRPGEDVHRAVMTIPVNFGGPQRRALRAAARKAGVGVVQFVHEPVAALYAYLRSQADFRRQLARFENRTVLVFDWGGGTLDLTLCRIQGGMILQIESLGDNDVGGDRFDERLRNLVREKHAKAHKLPDVVSLEQPGMAAKLLHQCETIKIQLSAPDALDQPVIIENYLRTEDASADVLSDVSRAELVAESRDIVARGLGRIDEILSNAGLERRDVELCLATGGMVNMPAIRDALAEYFPGRYHAPENGDRIISEGAAWIAHDDLRLCLSKPIEILSADTSGRGTYHTLVSEGITLPIENQAINVPNSRLYCVDPREGVACIEFAKPRATGRTPASAPRRTLQSLSVAVDPKASPLIERIICDLQIDHDYVAKATLRSTARGDRREIEFHELDFALALPGGQDGSTSYGRDDRKPDNASGPEVKAAGAVNITQRTNIAFLPGAEDRIDPFWKLVPGDIVARWKSSHFDTRSSSASARQHIERDFYEPCAWCARTISQITADGPVEDCRGRRCG